MNLRLLLIIALVAAAVATTWLLVRQPGGDAADTDATELPAGYYLLDATIIGTDESGHESYTLRARQIDHNPADDSVTLQDLVLTYAADNDANWKLDADSGRMPETGVRIDLSGNVVIAEKEPPPGAATISTSQLTVDILARTAETAESVRMTVANGYLTADGMRADLENKRVSLLSNVQGEFLATSAADEQ